MASENSRDCGDNLDLEELSVRLSSMRPDEKREVLKTISIDNLLERLYNSDEKQIKLACNVFDNIISLLSTDEIISTRQKHLYNGLSNKNPHIKALVLKTLVRITENGIIDLKLLVDIVPLLADDDGNVRHESTRILLQTAASPEGLRAMFDDEVIISFKKTMALSDIIRFRVYDLIVKIAKQSDESFRMCVENEFIDYLVSEIKSDDVLIQLNCLETLSDLAVYPQGMRHLEETGVLRNLENLFTPSDSLLMTNFLQPGLIKFFGGIAHVYPKETCSRHPVFLNEVCDLLDSNDPTSIGIAIETVGIVGSSVEGKMFLETTGHLMSRFIDVLVTILKASNTELQIKALISFDRLLNFNRSEETTELVVLLRTWYDKSHSHLTEHTIAHMKSPFEQIRLAAMRLIRTIARLSWAQTYLNDYPGFVEYLLDRTTESGSKEGKEAKFEIIKTLAESANTYITMGNIVLLRLKEYVLDGPFYVRREAAVEIDGSN